jgi:hypothetical protein
MQKIKGNLRNLKTIKKQVNAKKTASTNQKEINKNKYFSTNNIANRLQKKHHYR